MFADVGNVPAVITKGGDGYEGGGGWGFGWIFALVIIFLALVFLWGRKDDGGYRHIPVPDYNGGGAAIGAFNEINGRFNAIESRMDHKEDREFMREILAKECNLDHTIMQNRFEGAKEMWETNRNIDNVRFENERNTRAIIEAANANTGKILDRMHYDLEMALRDKIMEERFEKSQYRQDLFIERGNDRIINTLTTKHTIPPCPPPNFGYVCEPYPYSC